MTDLANVVRLGRHSAKVAEVRAIARGKLPGRTVADGFKLVSDLLSAHAPIDDVVVAESLLPRIASDPAFADRFAARRILAVADSVLEDLAPTRSSQGVVATLRVSSRPVPAAGLAVYLDRLQEPGNVGAVVRAAAAFGAAGVACGPGCADPFAPKALRASAGAVLVVPVETDAHFKSLAARFRERGGSVVATVGGAGRPARDWTPARPLLLVLGNEGVGVSPELVAACDESIALPMENGVESLNVAVTAGIFLAALAGVVPSPILDL